MTPLLCNLLQNVDTNFEDDYVESLPAASALIGFASWLPISFLLASNTCQASDLALLSPSCAEAKY